MARFTDPQNPPDAPLKVGVRGMYRLAVSDVSPNGKNFRYNLVDAEGNHYSAVSRKCFSKNQLVRCIVQFTFINYEKRISQIIICKKQNIDDKPPTPGKKKNYLERILSRSTVNPGFIPTDYPFREGSPKQVNKTGSYRFTVDLCLPCPNETPCKYVYQMLDCHNQKYNAVSDIIYEKGSTLVCRVEVLKEGINRKFFLTITDDESSQAVCLVDRRIIARKNYTPHYPKPAPSSKSQSKLKKRKDSEPAIVSERTEAVFNRKAAEIFDSLKASGFHNCGKDFVCSCCGKEYRIHQGIKSDTKELYLCNSCRGSMRIRERHSNSLYTIFTPMGNKR